MKQYKKPIVLINEDLAEGVYAASGACFTTDAKIVQTPDFGSNTYCVQMNASHSSEDSHHSSRQVFEIKFNQIVTYVASNAVHVDGSGSNTLILEYDYHANGVESIGLGNLYIEAPAGLSIISAKNVSCNLDCGIH